LSEPILSLDQIFLDRTDRIEQRAWPKTQQQAGGRRKRAKPRG
jgi:hypothetical protein